MNIKGFKDINNDKDKDKKKDKKTTDSYIGGHSSGLNVENRDDEDGYKKQRHQFKITKWRNGFQIDDGEFRDFSSEENKQFMEEIDKGYVPQEFIKKGMKEVGIAKQDNS